MAGDFSADGPAASRFMTAVWFPKEMGEVTVTYADSKFSFTIGGEKIYSHYMSVHPSYTVSGTTISGTLNMEKPAGFVQFFVPGISAADAPTYKLMESHLTPKTCDYVALAGGVTESALTAGYAIKGTAFTSDASVTGALFGGYLSSAGVATAYEFSLVKEISVEKPAALGTYTLKGTKTIDAGTSMTFPNISNTTAWGDLSPFVSLGFGNILWATGNLGRPYPSAPISKTNYQIESPLEAGDYFQWGAKVVYNTSTYNEQWTGTTYEDGLLPKAQDVAYQVNNAWRIPSMDQLDALYDSENTNATTYSQSWKGGWTSLGPTKGGMLLTSKKNGISLFLAAAGYYDNGSLDDEGDYVYFWSSTPRDANSAYFLYFSDGKINSDYSSRYFGYSVRPVQNIVTP